MDCFSLSSNLGECLARGVGATAASDRSMIMYFLLIPYDSESLDCYACLSLFEILFRALCHSMQMTDRQIFVKVYVV